MALQNVQNKDMGLVLSSDAKPRLKWTPELHKRFIDAVNQLGGADKATPKSLMRVMGIHGLTLYHLKSHLQKFRLGKSQQSQTYNENKPEEDRENRSRPFIAEICEGTRNPSHESTQIAQALQMQMEVQRKLYEQIEVQRHLQLRIEAQGKYLQSVLQKAQETLAGYNASAAGVELAKAELSQLVSMADDIGCPTSSPSAVTEMEGSMLKELENKQVTGNGCSVESSLTSSESSGGKEISQIAHESDETEKWRRKSVVLSLMEMQPGQNSGSGEANERKRKGSNACVEKPIAKRLHSHRSDEQQSRKFGFLENLDLNSKYLNDLDSGPKTLDLNCHGVDQPNGYI